jgi:tetratricopeptide (TPR) repeat protein
MEQVDIQRQAAEAWAEFARGKRDAAVQTMQDAAEREGRTEKHPITPGPLAPAREQLAEMLLDLDRPQEALKEFEAVQRNEPNRFRAVYGAARAAELAGDSETAKRHYVRLTSLAAKADTTRPEIEAAKKYLAN